MLEMVTNSDSYKAAGYYKRVEDMVEKYLDCVYMNDPLFPLSNNDIIELYGSKKSYDRIMKAINGDGTGLDVFTIESFKNDYENLTKELSTVEGINLSRDLTKYDMGFYYVVHSNKQKAYFLKAKSDSEFNG